MPSYHAEAAHKASPPFLGLDIGGSQSLRKKSECDARGASSTVLDRWLPFSQYGECEAHRVWRVGSQGFAGDHGSKGCPLLRGWQAVDRGLARSMRGSHLLLSFSGERTSRERRTREGEFSEELRRSRWQGRRERASDGKEGSRHERHATARLFSTARWQSSVFGLLGPTAT